MKNMSKRLTLNNEKRKNIENVFKSYWEKNNIFIQQLNEAKNKYNSMRTKMLELCNNIVRENQPQEDVYTIRRLINNYGEDNGGKLYHDTCFNFYRVSVNDDGEEDTEEVNVDFSLDDNKKFARAYYRDELKSKGHKINHPVLPIGGGQMILIDEERDVLIGASDWRKDGLAIGY